MVRYDSVVPTSLCCIVVIVVVGSLIVVAAVVFVRCATTCFLREYCIHTFRLIFNELFEHEADACVAYVLDSAAGRDWLAELGGVKVTLRSQVSRGGGAPRTIESVKDITPSNQSCSSLVLLLLW